MISANFLLLRYKRVPSTKDIFGQIDEIFKEKGNLISLVSLSLPDVRILKKERKKTHMFYLMHKFEQEFLFTSFYRKYFYLK